MLKRIFVSIDPPQEIEEYLEGLRRQEILWIKWMKTQNLHITLNFLGDLNEQEIAKASGVIADVVPFHNQFQLLLENLKTERDMLWLLPEKSSQLLDLQSELQTKLREARVGKRERRGYIPHILLAKSKTGRRMEQVIEKFEPMKFLVDKINLYESELTPGAATHKLIQSFGLNQ